MINGDGEYLLIVQESRVLSSRSESLFMIKNPYQSRSGTDEIILVVDLQLKPGTEEAFEELMHRSIPKTRAEAGNLEFTLLRLHAKSSTYVLLERWKDQAAIDWHMEQEYTKEIFFMFGECLAFPIEKAMEHIDFAEDVVP